MNRRFDSFHMGFEQFDALFYNMFNSSSSFTFLLYCR